MNLPTEEQVLRAANESCQRRLKESGNDKLFWYFNDLGPAEWVRCLNWIREQMSLCTSGNKEPKTESILPSGNKFPSYDLFSAWVRKSWADEDEEPSCRECYEWIKGQVSIDESSEIASSNYQPDLTGREMQDYILNGGVTEIDDARLLEDSYKFATRFASTGMGKMDEALRECRSYAYQAGFLAGHRTARGAK